MKRCVQRSRRRLAVHSTEGSNEYEIPIIVVVSQCLHPSEKAGNFVTHYEEYILVWEEDGIIGWNGTDVALQTWALR